MLVRQGDALERLADADICAFDKTGTLTLGEPRVRAACSLRPDLSDRRSSTGSAAGAERRSEHPLGRAVVQGYRRRAGRFPTAKIFR